MHARQGDILNTKFELFEAFRNLVDDLLLHGRAAWANEVAAGRCELHCDIVLPSVVHMYFTRLRNDGVQRIWKGK